MQLDRMLVLIGTLYQSRINISNNALAHTSNRNSQSDKEKGTRNLICKLKQWTSTLNESGTYACVNLEVSQGSLQLRCIADEAAV